jgi:hypothetical protein
MVFFENPTELPADLWYAAFVTMRTVTAVGSHEGTAKHARITLKLGLLHHLRESIAFFLPAAERVLERAP